MSEISKYIVKAKRIDNNEWEYGHVIRYGWTGEEKWYIVPDYASTLYAYEINPETICRYTGLTDKIGTRIYEKDIVELLGYNREVVFCNSDETSFFGIMGTPSDVWQFSRACPPKAMKVIGNRIDNPEYIKTNGVI